MPQQNWPLRVNANDSTIDRQSRFMALLSCYACAVFQWHHTSDECRRLIFSIALPGSQYAAGVRWQNLRGSYLPSLPARQEWMNRRVQRYHQIHSTGKVEVV